MTKSIFHFDFCDFAHLFDSWFWQIEWDVEKFKVIRTKRLKTLGLHAVAAKRNRLQNNLGKILAHLRQHGFISNNEVEKLCSVADSTATKYLKDLEKQGLVIPIGRKGRSLRWRLKAAIP